MSMLPNREDVFALLENMCLPKDEQSLLFQSPVAEVCCTRGQDFTSALCRLEALKRKGYYLCGYISYEASYLVADKKNFTFNSAEKNHHPLLHFYAFKTCLRISSEAITAILEQQNAQPSALPVAIQNIHLNMDKQEYLDKIQHIKTHIHRGDTYQVNFTQKYRFEYQGCALLLYNALRKRQTVEFGAFLNFPEFNVLSLSPELFLRKTNDTITAKPMKGTFPRGASLQEDAQIIQIMQNDAKTLSENAMIVDLLRNDLNRIANLGSVCVSKLFEIQTFETLHQMVSTVSGQVATQTNIEHVIQQLFPCGSITGAPKIRTMQIIEALEKERRGIYTGAIGYITPEHDFCFNVPIRTCIAYKDGTAEMGVGSGILFDSSPEVEYEECLLKARFLTDLNASLTLFESMKYCAWSQTVCHLSKHLRRLQHSAKCLHFKMSKEHISEQIRTAVLGLKCDHKVKVVLFQSGKVCIYCTALENPPKSPLLTVNISPQTVDQRNFLLQHKTSARKLYDHEYIRHQSQGAYDVLFLNQDHVLTESSRHNLFIKRNHLYYTSPILSGLLPGIARQRFLANHVDSCIEKNITPKDLLEADQILLTNAVRGIIEVTLSQQAIHQLHKIRDRGLENAVSY